MGFNALTNPGSGGAMICTILQWFHTPLLRPAQQTGGQARRDGDAATRRREWDVQELGHVLQGGPDRAVTD
jgi:hypothetical protein